MFGSSFSVPPRTEPMPIYRWWKGEPAARVVASERVVLSKANEVLARLSQPPMARLADLLDVDEAFIAVSEDFDQYPGRTATRYWGNVANLEKGGAAAVAHGGGKAASSPYLKPGHGHFEKDSHALRAIDAAVVVHAPGVSDLVIRKPHRRQRGVLRRACTHGRRAARMRSGHLPCRRREPSRLW
jgi:hypothetical protein